MQYLFNPFLTDARFVIWTVSWTPLQHCYKCKKIKCILNQEKIECIIIIFCFSQKINFKKFLFGKCYMCVKWLRCWWLFQVFGHISHWCWCSTHICKSDSKRQGKILMIAHILWLQKNLIANFLIYLNSNFTLRCLGE